LDLLQTIIRRRF